MSCKFITKKEIIHGINECAAWIEHINICSNPDNPKGYCVLSNRDAGNTCLCPKQKKLDIKELEKENATME